MSSPPFELLTDIQLGEIRQKLIDNQGNPECLGLDYLTIMRNVIYTCRMKANPMQDTPEGEGAAKPKKKEKLPSVNKTVLKGESLDDFFG